MKLYSVPRDVVVASFAWVTIQFLIVSPPALYLGMVLPRTLPATPLRHITLCLAIYIVFRTFHFSRRRHGNSILVASVAAICAVYPGLFYPGGSTSLSNVAPADIVIALIGGLLLFEAVRRALGLPLLLISLLAVLVVTIHSREHGFEAVWETLILRYWFDSYSSALAVLLLPFVLIGQILSFTPAGRRAASVVAQIVGAVRRQKNVRLSNSTLPATRFGNLHRLYRTVMGPPRRLLTFPFRNHVSAWIMFGIFLLALPAPKSRTGIASWVPGPSTYSQLLVLAVLVFASTLPFVTIRRVSIENSFTALLDYLWLILISVTVSILVLPFLPGFSLKYSIVLTLLFFAAWAWRKDRQDLLGSFAASFVALYVSLFVAALLLAFGYFFVSEMRQVLATWGLAYEIWIVILAALCVGITLLVERAPRKSAWRVLALIPWLMPIIGFAIAIFGFEMEFGPASLGAVAVAIAGFVSYHLARPQRNLWFQIVHVVTRACSFTAVVVIAAAWIDLVFPAFYTFP